MGKDPTEFSADFQGSAQRTVMDEQSFYHPSDIFYQPHIEPTRQQHPMSTRPPEAPHACTGYQLALQTLQPVSIRGAAWAIGAHVSCHLLLYLHLLALCFDYEELGCLSGFFREAGSTAQPEGMQHPYSKWEGNMKGHKYSLLWPVWKETNQHILVSW